MFCLLASPWRWSVNFFLHLALSWVSYSITIFFLLLSSCLASCTLHLPWLGILYICNPCSKQFFLWIAFLLKTVKMDLFPFTIFLEPSHFLPFLSTLFLKFLSNTFWNFPGVSSLSFLMSMFLNRTKPCSRYSTLPGYSTIYMQENWFY